MLAIPLDFYVCNTNLYHRRIEYTINKLDLSSGHYKKLETVGDLDSYLEGLHVLSFAKQSKWAC